MTEKIQPPGAGVRIASVQIENVKNVKAFHVSPGPTGLTIVGGKNAQGKTSVLDAIAWALGGAKKQPTNPQRNGAMSPPSISITLSNGIRAERKGKNSALTVIDPSGQRGGQALLDAFVSEFALDLPKFLGAPPREKAQILLRILGIGDQLVKLDQDEKRLYNERHAIGQIKIAKEKHASELPEYSDAPAEPLSISDLLQRQQAVLTRNGENQRKRENKNRIVRDLDSVSLEIRNLEARLVQLREAETALVADLETAEREAADLVDESTAELERQIAEFEAINHQIAANQQKQAARDEAEQYAAQYEAKSIEIEGIRKARLELLEGAPLPLDGLTVEEGDLRYNGQPWDGMSGAEQFRVAVAIVRALKPECQFVLMDKLEQMDLDTLREFGAWLDAEGLQVIATRVSTGDECAIIIEDGLPAGKTYADVVTGVSASAAEPAIPEEF